MAILQIISMIVLFWFNFFRYQKQWNGIIIAKVNKNLFLQLYFYILIFYVIVCQDDRLTLFN
jgi:hypothetical protein